MPTFEEQQFLAKYEQLREDMRSSHAGTRQMAEVKLNKLLRLSSEPARRLLSWGPHARLNIELAEGIDLGYERRSIAYPGTCSGRGDLSHEEVVERYHKIAQRLAG